MSVGQWGRLCLICWRRARTLWGLIIREPRQTSLRISMLGGLLRRVSRFKLWRGAAEHWRGDGAQSG
eukprot:815370-Pyramimonas_sp.AAC.1